ncbi:hypothetical protein CERSUDRAFT_101040 [Gelatoporia subvermispora B]|uniref:Uncharacterized protein n=1 Tax=Ceriporiopsis subvermispora (strain B) TaxID=914234 RepID=M2QFD6_CERS8|nr:hypothetical protein CERSUDRAFT_101040 [Gelatoporia subvermispora B]
MPTFRKNAVILFSAFSTSTAVILLGPSQHAGASMLYINWWPRLRRRQQSIHSLGGLASSLRHQRVPQGRHHIHIPHDSCTAPRVQRGQTDKDRRADMLLCRRFLLWERGAVPSGTVATAPSTNGGGKRSRTGTRAAPSSQPIVPFPAQTGLHGRDGGRTHAPGLLM